MKIKSMTLKEAEALLKTTELSRMIYWSGLPIPIRISQGKILKSDSNKCH